MDLLRKKELFATLKKCWIHQNEDCFLGYINLAKGINIEDK